MQQKPRFVVHSAVADFRTRYGPWALVAGASEGLGAEFATQLAAKGLNLVLIARREKLLDELGKKIMNDLSIQVRPRAISILVFWSTMQPPPSSAHTSIPLFKTT